MFSWLRCTARAAWNALSLVVLLGVVATIPILQFASLGYMLESAARKSRGIPLRQCFPGASTAGQLLVLFACAFVSWLPVWLVTDLAYTGELIESGSPIAGRLRLVARVLSIVWILWLLWAIFRGGKLRHFLWPAPVYAIKSLFRWSFWRDAEDRLWTFVTSLRLPQLLWIGFFASVGAIVWLLVPASLIVLGLSVKGQGAGALGLLGAVAMIWVLSLLPFLQIQLARDMKFLSVFDVRSARRNFRQAPWSCVVAIWSICLFAIPLYLLRIEPPPSQLWWILSLFFVMLMYPARLLCGWAIGRGQRRLDGFRAASLQGVSVAEKPTDSLQGVSCSEKPTNGLLSVSVAERPTNGDVFWLWRYIAWLFQLVPVVVYLGVLYLAKFAVWEGAASIYLQHAFLPPVPFFVR